MALPAAAIAGIIASGAATQAGSNIMSALGQHGANLENLDAARDLRNWQTYMSNTAHQREVADLRAAGLNPILSTVGTGASVPSGTMPQIGNVAASAGEAGNALNSAARAMAMDIQTKELSNSQIAAETEKTQADTNVARQNEMTLMQQANLNSAQALKVAEETKLPPAYKALMRAQAEQATEGARLASAERSLVQEKTDAASIANEMLRTDSRIKDESESTETFVKKYGWFWDEMLKLGKAAGAVYGAFQAAGASRNFLQAMRERGMPVNENVETEHYKIGPKGRMIKTGQTSTERIRWKK